MGGESVQPLSAVPGAFRAGHPKLDALCEALRKHGAVGASLTGAGRGGCVIGLFEEASAATAAAKFIQSDFAELEESDVFVARPIAGRGLLSFPSLPAESPS